MDIFQKKKIDLTNNDPPKRLQYEKWRFFLTLLKYESLGKYFKIRQKWPIELNQYSHILDIWSEGEKEKKRNKDTFLYGINPACHGINRLSRSWMNINTGWISNVLSAQRNPTKVFFFIHPYNKLLLLEYISARVSRTVLANTRVPPSSLHF